MGFCLALAPAAVASSTPFTWVGTSTTGDEEGYWSEAGNWEANAAPPASSEIGTLTFPLLTSTACTVEMEDDPCYFSVNDVSGLTAESIQIDDGDGYFIAGEQLTLAQGGFTASPATGSSGPATDFIGMPIQLSASQKWHIANRSGGGIEENGVLLFSGLTASTSTDLTVELSNGPALFLDNRSEVGPVTIEGPNTVGERISNGSVFLGRGELNSSDRQAVNLSHIFFAGSGAVGPLTTDGATLDAGSGGYPAEGLEALSVKLDPSSGVLFEITGSGSAAESDYSQLVSAGPVELAGSIVVVVAPSSRGGPCPVLIPGHTYTFLTTTGPLSGSFADAPEGGREIPVYFSKSCSQLSQTIRISYNRSGGTETVTGTVEEAAQKKQEEAIEKLGEERAKLVAEEAGAIKKHEEEAAAKRRQEEEAAKAGVLGVKEGSPDARIAGTSLRASAAGTVSVKISCPEGVSRCAGTVTLRTLNAVTAGVARTAKTKPAILTLATGSFTVAGGRAATVVLHLSARARQLLARSHLLRVRATVVARDRAGATNTWHTIVTLRAPKTKPGKG